MEGYWYWCVMNDRLCFRVYHKFYWRPFHHIGSGWCSQVLKVLDLYYSIRYSCSFCRFSPFGEYGNDVGIGGGSLRRGHVHLYMSPFLVPVKVLSVMLIDVISLLTPPIFEKLNKFNACFPAQEQLVRAVGNVNDLTGTNYFPVISCSWKSCN